jgi:hypothetical protein
VKGVERRGRHKDRRPDQYVVVNVTPVEKCVGAFRRPCVQLTSAILCDDCWETVQATPQHLWKSMGQGE